jgi:hypothetical protein
MPGSGGSRETEKTTHQIALHTAGLSVVLAQVVMRSGQSFLLPWVGSFSTAIWNTASCGFTQAICCADFAEVRAAGRNEMAADNTLAMSIGWSRLWGDASRFWAF